MTTPSAQAFHQSFVQNAQSVQYHASALASAERLLAPDSALELRFIDGLREVLDETVTSDRIRKARELWREYENAEEDAFGRIREMAGTTTDAQLQKELRVRQGQWVSLGGELHKCISLLELSAHYELGAQMMHDTAVSLQAAGQ